MRILHTSDWHLGLALHGVSFMEEQRYFIEQFLGLVKAEQVDAVIIAGDVFDHAMSSGDSIELYSKAMTGLCSDLKVPVLICSGNHDGASRLASCNVLLEKTGLYIAGKVKKKTEPIIIGDAAFYLLPYFTLDEVRYLFPGEELNTYQEGMEVLLKEMKVEAVSGKKNFLVAHCFALGGETSESDRSAVVGGASMVGAEIFKDFDYVALGHLHKKQAMAQNVYYSGTPLKYSFTEANQQKSVSLIDTKDMSVKHIPILPLRDVRLIKGNYESILDFMQEDERKEDYIKIELSDAYASLEKLTAFRQFYPNLLTVIGMPMELKHKASTITVEELGRLSSEDIFMRFCKEVSGIEVDDEILTWFNQALEATQKEGDVQ